MTEFRGFKSRLTTVAWLLPVLVATSLLLSFSADKGVNPDFTERLVVTFVGPFDAWCYLCRIWLPIVLIVSCLVAILVICGIRQKGNIFFIISLLVLSGTWLFLVWFAWILKYAILV
jgi:amino acid transporter